jgi:REP element-mobilizing transposase RayT
LARPLRIEFDGAWYHVMNRGAGKRLVFRSAYHRAMFLKLLDEVSKIFGIEIHAYCLMGNHYHLLVHTPTAGLGRAMRHLDGVYTQRFNRSVGTDGPLFRGRYKAVLVSAESHLCRVSRYIHLNPVEGQLVAQPEDYEYSSYRAYLGLEEVPPWLHTAETLSRFAPGDVRENYRRFVESGIDSETQAFYAKRRLSPVMGPKGFRERIRNLVKATPIGSDPEIPDRHRVKERPALPEIARAVCLAFSVSLFDLRSASRRTKGCSLARGALVRLGREVGGQSLAAIADWIGYRSPAGASKAMIRLVARMGEDRDVRARVATAHRLLTERGVSPSECKAKT